MSFTSVDEDSKVAIRNRPIDIYTQLLDDMLELRMRPFLEPTLKTVELTKTNETVMSDDNDGFVRFLCVVDRTKDRTYPKTLAYCQILQSIHPMIIQKRAEFFTNAKKNFYVHDLRGDACVEYYEYRLKLEFALNLERRAMCAHNTIV